MSGVLRDSFSLAPLDDFTQIRIQITHPGTPVNESGSVMRGDVFVYGTVLRNITDVYTVHMAWADLVPRFEPLQCSDVGGQWNPSGLERGTRSTQAIVYCMNVRNIAK